MTTEKKQRKGTGSSDGYENCYETGWGKMSRGTQVKRDGLAVTVERRGISRSISLWHLSHPWLHVGSVKDHTGGESAPRGVGPRVRLSGQAGLKMPGHSHTSPHHNNTWGTLGIHNCGGPISWFSFGHQGNFLCAHWSPWPAFLPIPYCNGTVRTSQTLLFQSSSTLQLGLCAIFTGVRCQFPSPLLERDILKKVQASVFMNMEPTLLNWTKWKCKLNKMYLF